MNKVVPIRPNYAEIDRIGQQAERLVKGGGGGDNGGMEVRVKALETAVQGINDRLTKIETKLEHVPTKADLSEALHSQTRWVIGTAIALAAVAFAAAKLL